MTATSETSNSRATIVVGFDQTNSYRASRLTVTLDIRFLALFYSRRVGVNERGRDRVAYVRCFRTASATLCSTGFSSACSIADDNTMDAESLITTGRTT